MSAQRLVEALDLAEAGHPSLRLRLEASAGGLLAFEGGKEAFGHGVVVGVTDGAHGPAHACLLASVAEEQRRVLRALVRLVVDVSRLALADRHIRGVQYQFRAQVVGHGPSHDPTAEHIKHPREIEEGSDRRHVRDIGHPERGLGRKVAIDEVGSRAFLLVRPRRDGLIVSMAGTNETSLTHQPGDALTGFPPALGAVSPCRPVADGLRGRLELTGEVVPITTDAGQLDHLSAKLGWVWGRLLGIGQTRHVKASSVSTKPGQYHSLPLPRPQTPSLARVPSSGGEPKSRKSTGTPDNPLARRQSPLNPTHIEGWLNRDRDPIRRPESATRIAAQCCWHPS